MTQLRRVWAAFLIALVGTLESHAASIFGRVEGGLRSTSFASKTSRALFESSFMTGFGAGAGVEVGPRFFVALDARHSRRTGERAFAVDSSSEGFRLGHPLKFKMTTLVASADFRFRPEGIFRPYVGASLGYAMWSEASDIAGLIEKSDGTAPVFDLRAGVLREWGRLNVQVESGVTAIPGAIGKAGISAVYREKNLGGFFVVARTAFRF